MHKQRYNQMTVKIYISRNPDGTEQHFRETYERNAALQIAKTFWKVYQPVKTKLYTLIFNVQNPPADLVIISNDGMGIIDMKHIGDRVEGNERSTWHIVDPNGDKKTIENRHINPAKQVLDYKTTIYRDLREFATMHAEIPKWIQLDEFFTQGAILFTSDQFSPDGINLGSYATWLKLLWLDSVTDWAQSLSFQHRRSRQHFRLNDSEIEYIASYFFNTSPWNEIEGFLSARDPYGYLFLVEGNQRKVRISLETETARIGRSRENDISLESLYVSGIHCQITHKPDGNFLEDLGSGNGTWLNGIQLTKGKKQKIKSGDEIVLGPMDNGLPHDSAIVLRYLAATTTKTAATVIYKE